MTETDKIILANVHALAVGVADIAIKMEQAAQAVKSFIKAIPKKYHHGKKTF